MGNCKCQWLWELPTVLGFFQDLSVWWKGRATAQDMCRSMMGTSGKLSVLPTLVPKLLTWSAGSFSVVQPCLSLEEVTLEKGWVPSGTESCSVWGMNPSSHPAPGGPPGTSPAPTQAALLSPAQVRTRGGVLNPDAVLGAGEQSRGHVGTGVRTGGVAGVVCRMEIV